MRRGGGVILVCAIWLNAASVERAHAEGHPGLDGDDTGATLSLNYQLDSVMGFTCRSGRVGETSIEPMTMLDFMTIEGVLRGYATVRVAAVAMTAITSLVAHDDSPADCQRLGGVRLHSPVYRLEVRLRGVCVEVHSSTEILCAAEEPYFASRDGLLTAQLAPFVGWLRGSVDCAGRAGSVLRMATELGCD